MTASAAAAPLSPAADRALRETATMIRFGLRSQRWWLAGVAFLGFVSPYSTGAAYATAAGTAAARAALGQQTVSLGASLAYLVPLPIRPDTVAGYVWWKGLAWLTVVFGAWGLAAATSLVRSAEERGITESWLASATGRTRLVVASTASFVLAAVGAVVFTGLGTAAGLAAGKAPIGLSPLVEQGAALLGIALACFGIGLVASQLAVTRRGALALGTVVLLALYAVDALARVNPAVVGPALISPFHLADLTTAVVPGGRFDGGATVALFAIALVLVALSAIGFGRRDLLSSLLPRRRPEVQAARTPSTEPALRLPVLSRLWQQRFGLAGWLLGTVVGAAVLVSLAQGTGKLVASVSGFDRLIRASGTRDPALWMVSSFWFGVASLILAAYAIAQVSRWASDDAEGRLEMEIAQPVPRWRVVAERGITLTVGASLIAALGSLVTAAELPSQGLHIGAGALVVATLLLVPLTLTFAALGALLIARVPRVAVPVLGVLAVLGFYVPELAPLFRWPGWSLDLSLFHLYGTPLTTGVFWTGLWIMLGIVVVGFGGAMAAMGRREVAR